MKPNTQRKRGEKKRQDKEHCTIIMGEMHAHGAWNIPPIHERSIKNPPLLKMIYIEFPGDTFVLVNQILEFTYH